MATLILAFPSFLGGLKLDKALAFFFEDLEINDSIKFDVNFLNKTLYIRV